MFCNRQAHDDYRNPEDQLDVDPEEELTRQLIGENETVSGRESPLRFATDIHSKINILLLDGTSHPHPDEQGGIDENDLFEFQELDNIPNPDHNIELMTKNTLENILLGPKTKEVLMQEGISEVVIYIFIRFCWNDFQSVERLKVVDQSDQYLDLLVQFATSKVVTDIPIQIESVMITRRKSLIGTIFFQIDDLLLEKSSQPIESFKL